ncbi:PKD domain-containing protein, partial [Bacteroidales bacterium AH-315-I05]|nr:PKD domain-containing protein [Bacteroidales bacterium AH-315-I05]
QMNPTHIYVSPGNYNVTLSAFGGPGNATVSITNQVVVYPNPTANFQAYPNTVLDSADTVYFADNSLDAWSWNWDFGDGNSDTIQNPTHYYATNGSYFVTLVITNAFGCKDSITKQAVFIAVGIKDFLEGVESINIYPNPFSDNLNLELDLKEYGSLSTKLLNIQGQQISETIESKMIPGANQIQWSGLINDLQPGMYIMEINYNGKKYYKKLVHSK